MIITKKHLERRTFLRGMGLTIALPLLDAMIPALTAQSKTAATPRKLLGWVYIPNGVNQLKWTPANAGPEFELDAKGGYKNADVGKILKISAGSEFELSPTLKPLEPYKKQLTVVSGLANPQADSLGDGGGEHARAGTVWLSGVHPKRTEALDVRAGITIDQMIAKTIGQETPLPSIEIALEENDYVGVCDVGYTCVYVNTISWRTPTSPLPMETNPRILFERMFGEPGTPTQRATRLRDHASILDDITGNIRRLQGTLGQRDQARVGEYLENIREIERRIQKAAQQGNANVSLPEAPVGIPDSYDEHAKLMFDLQALAFQADITRVFTFMLAHEVSSRSYPQIGVKEGHHGVSHHQNNPDTLEKYQKINMYHVSLFGHFLEKLKAIQDGEGTLLDHATIMYGGGMGNGNEHSHFSLPTVIAGAGLGLKGDRHIHYPEHTPMADLLLTLAQKAGSQSERFGDSSGPLSEI